MYLVVTTCPVISTVIVLVMLALCHTETSSGTFDVFDRCPGPYGTVLKSYKSPSLEFCCLQCHNNPECFSVVFDPSNQDCEENAGKTTRFPSGCATTVKYVPLKQRSNRSVLHGACDTDVDCTTARSNCRNGICACTLGFSYNPETVSCVTSCVTYGTSFTEHQGYLDSALALPVVLLNVTNLDACEKECTTAVSFMCLSFNYISSPSLQCRLKDVALSMQTTDSLKAQNGTAKYLHRNCE